jgi:hypothetical protein
MQSGNLIKCAHQPCQYLVEIEDQFCSSACAAAKDTPDRPARVDTQNALIKAGVVHPRDSEDLPRDAKEESERNQAGRRQRLHHYLAARCPAPTLPPMASFDWPLTPV